MSIAVRSTVALALLFSLLGCQATPDAAPDTPAGTTPAALFDTWTLTSLEGNPVDALLPQGAKAPWIIIAPDGKVSGSTGVNSMGSKLDPEALSSGRFSLGPIMSTRRAGPPALMAVESAFVEALRKADSYSVKKSTLTLVRGKDEMMTFTATPASAPDSPSVPPKAR